MASFNVPDRDGDLVTALKNFTAAMETYATALGFDANDEAEIINAYQTFDQANTAAFAARGAAIGATATKDQARETSVNIMRSFAQRIKRNPNATPEIQSAFGITVESTIAGPVTTPTMLSAEARIDGSCRVTWDRNGNIRSTTFIIETSPDGMNWSFLATTTAARYNDTNAPVGTVRWYRVRAARAGQNSGWSNLAVIYGGTASSPLSVAA